MVHIYNVHERELPASVEKVGMLLGTLASRDDRLWPVKTWPAMRFDRPLEPGAEGGHGPIRYVIESYEPSQKIWFRFHAPRGFHGGHGYEILPMAHNRVILKHTLEMDISGIALLSWPFIFRPLHNALLEDSLDLAEQYCQPDIEITPSWSGWVRFLRWMLS